MFQNIEIYMARHVWLVPLKPLKALNSRRKRKICKSNDFQKNSYQFNYLIANRPQKQLKKCLKSSKLKSAITALKMLLFRSFFSNRHNFCHRLQ